MFLPFGGKAFATSTPEETRYLKKVHPSIKKFWDNNVIQLAEMLLKSKHSFNNKGLVVSIEINVGATGKIASTGLVASSGYDPFDDTAIEAVSSLERVPPPPKSLLSDDGKVHMFWTLKRVAPYSSAKMAQIRFVRYSTKTAIEKYTEQGLYQMAWQRLMHDSKTRGFNKEQISAFLAGVFFKLLGGSDMDAQVLQGIENVANTRILPGEPFVPFLPLAVGKSFYRIMLRKVSDITLCSMFRHSLGKSEDHATGCARELFLRRSTVCFDAKTRARIKQSRYEGVQLLLAGLEGKSAGAFGALHGVLVKALKGRFAPLALMAMGISGQANFLKDLKGRVSLSQNAEELAAALWAISVLPGKAAGLSLVNALRSKNNTTVMAAADLIWSYSGPEKMKTWKFATWELGNLIRKSKDPLVRKKAAFALVQITQGNLNNENNKYYFFLVLRTKDHASLTGIIPALNPQYPTSKKKLMSFVAHKKADLRALAIKRIADAGAPLPEPYLGKALVDSDVGVRVQAVRFCRDRKRLVAALQSVRRDMALYAARQLAKVDLPWLGATVSTLLKSKKSRDHMTAFILTSGLYGKTEH
ncbi:TonB C-terminal domain-containing protein [Myxococcota bacterium]|nr:TonB C-terminal domain-containing protein [Myxococcota bacterium]